MHIYVRRGGPNYQRGLARMRALGAELGIPIEVHHTLFLFATHFFNLLFELYECN